jgi:uncharacterized protein (TIGR01777 family)
MKVVIGGANGLIGKRLVQALRARGDDVVALVRTPGSASFGEGVTVAQWDGRSLGPWASHVNGAGAVVNLAGASVAAHRWTEAFKREIADTRVDSTRAFVAAIAAAQHRPKVFVSASAVGIYGDRGDALLDESAAPGAGFLAGVCKAWEEEASRAEALGVRVPLIRTGVVLARPSEGGALQQMVIPFKLFAGGPIGSGKQWLPWIHIEDEVAIFLWAIGDARASGPVNAAAPAPATMAAFSKALGHALGRPSWAPVPGFMLKLLVGEFADALLGGQRLVPKLLLDSGFEFRFKICEAALAELLP